MKYSQTERVKTDIASTEIRNVYISVNVVIDIPIRFFSNYGILFRTFITDYWIRDIVT
jgi:hypothetical protein